MVGLFLRRRQRASDRAALRRAARAPNSRLGVAPDSPVLNEPPNEALNLSGADGLALVAPIEFSIYSLGINRSLPCRLTRALAGYKLLQLQRCALF
jgi:hypothetical protein